MGALKQIHRTYTLNLTKSVGAERISLFCFPMFIKGPIIVKRLLTFTDFASVLNCSEKSFTRGFQEKVKK